MHGTRYAAITGPGSPTAAAAIHVAMLPTAQFDVARNGVEICLWAGTVKHRR